MELCVDAKCKDKYFLWAIAMCSYILLHMKLPLLFLIHIDEIIKLLPNLTWKNTYAVHASRHYVPNYILVWYYSQKRCTIPFLSNYPNKNGNIFISIYFSEEINHIYN